MIRCEISLDDGATWRLADIKRFEKPNPGGKFWCWVHYELAIPIGKPQTPKSLNPNPHL